MKTIFCQFGIFTIAIVLAIYAQIYQERKKYRDCLLFGRLLLATAAILFIDTLGWIIDGAPICGIVWITTVVDALDLILTTTVCWCWVKYAYLISNESRRKRKARIAFEDLVLLLQIILVSFSQVWGYYFYVDENGYYHRGSFYWIHTAISMGMLVYSTALCVKSCLKEKDQKKKEEMLFVALVILIPISGNIFQFFVYGYPTVWLCMVFMVLIVYIHIQNKRINLETARKNRMLEKALAEAKAANRTKMEFLTRMSHDMRTPMNGILGITYLMEDENEISQIKSELPKLRESGEYLLRLINDVLDLNKVESGELLLYPKECDEEQVFNSIIAMVRPLMEEKQIEFHFEKINIEWNKMLLDKDRVKQIFINLFTNAIKFTPNGGRIDFIMELVSKDGDMIRDKFVIRDNGIGMSEAFIPQMFQSFSQENRLHENLGGTGLGLTIVKNLVELMGGNISVKSEVDKGTEFTLYLNFPLVKHDGRAETSPEADEKPLPESYRVLLCEDHPLNAEIAARLLKKENATVTWVENGQLGVEAFENSENAYYDIIFMDIRMPVLDGIGAAKRIRLLDRVDAQTVPIVALTANAYEEDIQKSLEAGMDAHLAKPIDPAVLHATLLKYVRKRESLLEGK